MARYLVYSWQSKDYACKLHHELCNNYITKINILILPICQCVAFTNIWRFCHTLCNMIICARQVWLKCLKQGQTCRWCVLSGGERETDLWPSQRSLCPICRDVLDEEDQTLALTSVLLCHRRIGTEPRHCSDRCQALCTVNNSISTYLHSLIHFTRSAKSQT